MRKVFSIYIFLVLITVISCSKQEEKSGSAVIPPENVMNLAAAKKAKAVITGEKNEIEIAGETTNVWNILYKDDKGGLHSTIIRKDPDQKNKKGDSIIIYYDETNPVSLPIFEKRYLELSKPK